MSPTKKWEETSNTEIGLCQNSLFVVRRASHFASSMKTHNYSDPTVQNALGFFKVASEFESMMPVSKYPCLKFILF
ncbi:UNVERIFIED_CONTAM: hypothetical protein ABIC26_001628 [Paenibacillus sp. PvR008]